MVSTAMISQPKRERTYLQINVHRSIPLDLNIKPDLATITVSRTSLHSTTVYSNTQHYRFYMLLCRHQ